MNYWMLVSSPENFEISRKMNFSLAGMKSRHRKKAVDVRVGDKVIFYLTRIGSFGATAEVKGEFYEDDSLIWVSDKPNEFYPFRFMIEPEIVVNEKSFVKAEELKDQMEYIKKWPKEHWKLAFQGNVHRLPESDYLLIKSVLSERGK